MTMGGVYKSVYKIFTIKMYFSFATHQACDAPNRHHVKTYFESGLDVTCLQRNNI